MGESEGAVDGGGGQEGEEADEDDAREEEQGGDQQCYLERDSARLFIGHYGRRYADGDREKAHIKNLSFIRDTVVAGHFDFTLVVEGNNREHDDDEDGDKDEGVESEEGSQKGNRSYPEDHMGAKEQHGLHDRF